MSNKKQDFILRILLLVVLAIYSISFFLETLYKFNFGVTFLIGGIGMIVFHYLVSHELIKQHFFIFLFSPIGGMLLLLYFNKIIAVAYFLGATIVFLIRPIKA